MSYRVQYYNARWWVTYGARLLGGYSANELRTYVFPLYTPQGMLALQEAPPDHPHHQGIWTGLEINGHDLWNAGSRNLPRHRQTMVPALETLQPVISSSGVEFGHQVHWQTVEGTLLLYEKRSVSFRAHDEFTQVDWTSTFSHPAQATVIGQTKESGVAIRVPPHWESAFGGQIRNAMGDEGEAHCFDQNSPWLTIEGAALGTAAAGIVLLPTADMEPCPWFTRDYGCHIYNPARHGVINLAPAEELTWAVHVLAYDGHRTIEQINKFVGDLYTHETPPADVSV